MTKSYQRLQPRVKRTVHGAPKRSEIRHAVLRCGNFCRGFALNKHHRKEQPMPISQARSRAETSQARSRAESLFVRRQKQQSEGVQAMADYRRNQEHQLTNLARLRALRLERENGASSGTRK